MLTPATANASERQRVLRQAMEWFIELQSESCPETRRQAFQKWLTEAPDHQYAYQEAEHLWSTMDDLKFSKVPALEAARRAKPNNKIKPAVSVLVIGAALAVGWQDYTAEPLNITTAIGQRRTVDLIDGSHLDIDAASRLSVKLSWLRRRIELFEGHARFTVAHETLRPFTVRTGHVQVRDIGTVFTVQNDQQHVSVTVIEGEVAVSDQSHWISDPLKAGYQRKSDNNGHLRNAEKIDKETADAWLRGILVFNHTPLSVAVAEFERQHDVHFQFIDPDLAQQTINGRFASGDLDTFVNALKKILPIQVKVEQQTILLSLR